ncbi:MAG: RsiV family protein [bacterium]
MKQTIFILAVAAVLAVGCKHETKEFTTHSLSNMKCYLLTFDEEFFHFGKIVGEENSYSVEWPDEGVVSPAAERELKYLCFGDSASASVEVIADQWLESAASLRELGEGKFQQVDSLDETVGSYSYFKIESNCLQDNDLATFLVYKESYGIGAAHGLYSVNYLTVDKETGNAVHLADLVADTNLLCEAIAHAIQDLDVNKETRDCLFEEFIDVDLMPMPENFFVDSARNSITVLYGLYEITPYCCGIQSVVLPVFWLSKHAPLTPYAKKLFGSEASL